jgi:hypothetical protein
MDFINPIVFTPGMLTASNMPEVDYAVWNIANVYSIGDYVRLASTHHIYQCTAPHQGAPGVASGITITIASPGIFTWVGPHNLLAGAQLTLSTNGNLPAGLVSGTVYYVIVVSSTTFSLSQTPGGTAINTSGTQSGTHIATVASTQPDVSLIGAQAKWIDAGATNKYKLVDDKYGTQTLSNTALVTWSSGTAYVATDLVSTGGRIYKCMVGNTNFPPAANLSGATPKWIDVGPASVNVLSVDFTPGIAIDSIGLLNMLGSSVNVTCTVAGAPIYSSSFTLVTDLGVFDWKTYFLAPIVAASDKVFTDLLPYGLQVITVTITGPSAVAIGNVALGSLVAIGALEYNPHVGITDYSPKVTDAFGNVSVVKRAYSKRFSGRFRLANTFVDQLAGILASVRSTPVIWIGAGNNFGALVVWGYYKDFEIDIAYATVSYCTITIEGIV